MTEFHGGLIVIYGIIHAAHHALIITEEEDGQASHAIDGDQKLSLLELVHNVPFGDKIHDEKTIKVGGIFECMRSHV